ncbi:MAG: MarC family protein [Bacteroidetes bacterium]|nr:MarC family protein [Bacteroidota bacterium]MBU1579435.1 MarC family protein [Bacteroidota bacterium]MBU2557615.1 MarC family protein [Bacteroidota bacterium]
MNELLTHFILLFAVIDPIGTIPVIMASTAAYNQREKKRIALKAVGLSALVLLFFILAGELLLDAMDIPLSAFQIAGGIVLFVFALMMIFGESKPDDEIKSIKKNNDPSVFPLAIPSIASPGAMMAAVLLTENSIYGFWDQFITAIILLIVLLVVLILMLGSHFIFKLIGNGGASIISRVMGLLLASMAVKSILEGITDFFVL